MVEKSWEVNLHSPAGLALGKRRAVLMPARAHNSVLDRIVRGLYFHHFDEVLGRRALCKVAPLTGISQEIVPFIDLMSFASVGGDAFWYRYSRAADSPLDSLWILLFYQQYLVMVETRSRSRSNSKSNGPPSAAVD